MFLIFGLLCFGGAAYLATEAATAPSRERLKAIRRAAGYGRTRLGAGASEAFTDRALVPLRDWLASCVLRLHPRSTTDAVSLKLLSAGLALRITPSGFLATKAVLALAGLAFGALVGGAAGGAFHSVLGAVVLCIGGFTLPDFAVSSRARTRREQIRADLPDALDLLAVSVEAGMGFDGAVAKLTEHMEGPLADEFALTLGEMRIGESRQVALKKLAERVDTPEMANFTRALIQADQLGLSLGRILRVQAVDTRDRRQAAAEEKAMKAPIKMLFPTVLFIFPAMFVVVLGPAFLNLAKVF